VVLGTDHGEQVGSTQEHSTVQWNAVTRTDQVRMTHDLVEYVLHLTTYTRAGRVHVTHLSLTNGSTGNKMPAVYLLAEGEQGNTFAIQTEDRDDLVERTRTLIELAGMTNVGLVYRMTLTDLSELAKHQLAEQEG
jgi:hypothetical protein